MAWEIAIVMSVLGGMFFLVYLADKLDSENFLLNGIKVLLMMIALILLIVNAAIPAHIVTNLKAVNDTGVISSAGYTAFGNLSATNIKIITISVTTFIFLWFLWLIIYFIRTGYMKWMKKKNG